MQTVKSLSQLHFIAATMRACGSSVQEIASVTGLTDQWIYHVSISPLFIAEVARIREKLQNQLLDNAVSALQSEALASVQLLKNFRDNPLLSAPVRLKAAESILDRVPKTSKTQRHIDATPATLELTDAQVAQLSSVLNDDPIAMEAYVSAATIDLLAVEGSNSEL